MISLSASERKIVRDIIRQYATDQPYRVVVFGSRALNKAKKYSDVDVALIGDEPAPRGVTAALAEAFEDSRLPYTVDLVDFQRASETLKAEIERHGQDL